MSEKVYIAGSTGLLGSEVSTYFKLNHLSVIESESNVLDLRNSADTFDFIEMMKPDGIVFCAGRVGGIRENQTNSLDMFYENSKMQYSILQAALKLKVKKFIFISSAAIYPSKNSTCVEDDVWRGAPSPEHMQYALAKLSAMSFVTEVRESNKLHWISLIPTNIYGLNDNWSQFSGHVIGSLINKIVNAKEANIKSVDVWGSGNASREFLYAADAAEAVYLSYKGLERANYDRYNLTSGFKATIKEIAELIKEISGYCGNLNFDRSMPEGPTNRNLSGDRLNSFINWCPKITIRDGLTQSIKHFELYMSRKNIHDRF